MNVASRVTSRDGTSIAFERTGAGPALIVVDAAGNYRDFRPLRAPVERLAAGGRVADIGCGLGWSTIAVARAFPGAEVWGIDSDPGSIDDARAAAEEQRVHVRFECTDASRLASAGPFDVVLLLEALHDLARPVEILRAAREALAAD